MGMTKIDEDIESLQILKNSWEVSLRNSLNETERKINQDVVESLIIAIDTMRKYQKIEQIIKDIPYGGDVTVRRIQEVVEDD